MSIEKVIARVNDLQDGQMKEIDLHDRTLLLSRVNGQFFVTGAHCTHYGAPLANGVLSGYHVICPWHHTYFSILTGDMAEPPGLDGLPHFNVRVIGQNVIVSLPDYVQVHRAMDMAKYDPKADTRTFVVLGGGAAGGMAVETLRQDGFQGRLVMISREKQIPYDRPHLSKAYLREKGGPSGPPTLRSIQFYNDAGIELLMDRRVTRVNAQAKKIEFDGGSTLDYDKLLVATGGVPRGLSVPGNTLKNVFLLRSFDDAHAIAMAAEKATRAVVVGTSFIGMEVSGSFAERGLTVTVVGTDPIPFAKSLGDDIGQMYRKLHEDKGIAFELGTEVERFEGRDKVEAVVLKNGKRLEADLVVIGIGIKPATEFLEGVSKNTDGSVTVDATMKVTDDLYAAGDIATFPDFRTGQPVRIEHWRLAQQHGRCAAHNMAGHETEFRETTFFWTVQLKVSLRFVGYTREWDEIVFQGRPLDKKFMAYYVKDNRILAVAGCGHDAKMAAASELMREDRMPSVAEVRAGASDLVQQLKSAPATKP